MLEKIFLETIKKHKLIKKKDKIILAVSGGPDSVALLYSFLKIKQEYKLRLICAHFNHGLRKESDSEEDFINQLCQKLNLEVISEKKEVSKFFEGDSLEQTTRRLRFDFFLKCARQKQAKIVALAHHRDDLAETVLMRIIRGTGLRGLRGFLPKSTFKNLTLIRPFIGLRKNEILDWLNRQNIPFCTDKSNQDVRFLRNKIRLNLLPQLEEINKNITDRLSDLAVNTALDYDFIYNFSSDCFSRLRRKAGGKSLRLDLENLSKLHPAVFNNVLRFAIEQVKGDTRRVEQIHLNQARELIEKGRAQASIHIPYILIKKETKTVLIQSLIL